MRQTTEILWLGFWAGWLGGLGVYWCLKGMPLLGGLGVAVSILVLYTARQLQKL